MRNGGSEEPPPVCSQTGYATLSRMPTFREKLGGFLNAAERELAYQKAQPNPDQNAIAISEREVQRRKEELDRVPKE
jgi:hypothetical protein